ncbi:MAG: hypothetical protein ACP6IP_04055 [Candidatus Njordarchaeia archaeon]
MSKIWKVTFEGEDPGPADDFNLDFIDMNETIGSYLALKKEALDILEKLMKEKENYNVIGNIKDVSIPIPENIPIGAFFALLGIDKEELRFGFLLLMGKDELLLVGIWPEPFVDAVKENTNIMNAVVGSMLEQPENWRRVDLILPIEEKL